MTLVEVAIEVEVLVLWLDVHPVQPDPSLVGDNEVAGHEIVVGLVLLEGLVARQAGLHDVPDLGLQERHLVLPTYLDDVLERVPVVVPIGGHGKI